MIVFMKIKELFEGKRLELVLQYPASENRTELTGLKMTVRPGNIYIVIL